MWTLKYLPQTILLSAIFFVLILSSSAQTNVIDCGDNTPPDGFDIKIVGGQTRICLGETIQLDLTDFPCSTGINFTIDYGDGTQEGNPNDFSDPEFTHTYQEPGTYTMVLSTNCNFPDGSDGCIITKTNFLEVLDVDTPIEFTYSLCANKNVLLYINAFTNSYDEYEVDWGDGTVENFQRDNLDNVRHEYTTQNTVGITVKGFYNISGNLCEGRQEGISVSPIQNLVSTKINEIETKIRDDNFGGMNISFETQADFSYELYEIGEVNPVETVQGNGGTMSISVIGIDTENKSHCYKLVTIDGCGNRSDESTQNTYCNIGLAAIAEDSQNKLQWNISEDITFQDTFQQYVIYRNTQAIQTITDISVREFTDLEVTCNEDYVYQIVAEFNGSSIQFQAVSNREILQAFSTTIPPMVTKLNSTVENSRSIKLFWEVTNQPKVIEYKMVREQDTISSLSDEQSAIETDLTIDKRHCYEVFYINECGNTSPVSEVTCPVFLQAREVKVGQVDLNWTAYKNSGNSFEQYVIQKINEDGVVYEEIETFSNIMQNFSDLDEEIQVIQYRIKTIISGDVVSYSNTVEVKKRFRVFFPNAFTPNGDGLNDIFEPKGLFIKKFKMIIYDRLGEELYVSSSLTDGWNGYFKGNPAKQGVYVYVAEVEDYKGEKFNTKGTLTLIR